MDNINENEPPIEPTVWPPVQEQPAGIWPPAPVEAPQQTYPFKALYKRVEGKLSDYRLGTISIGADGVTIEGKAVRPAETQVPIALVFCLLSLLLGVLSLVIFEYAFRISSRTQVGWEAVKQTVLDPEKLIAGIAFSAPNPRGTIKTFSLVTKLLPNEYEMFAAQARLFAPQSIVEGRFKGRGSLLVPIIAVLAVIAFVLIVIAVKFSPTPSR